MPSNRFPQTHKEFFSLLIKFVILNAAVSFMIIANRLAVEERFSIKIIAHCSSRNLLRWDVTITPLEF